MTCPIKLISIDVDFTLVNDDKKVPKENRKAILWARYQRGVHIAINSGRIAPSVRTYMEEIGIDDAYPSLGGCIVQKADGTIIEEHSIDNRVALEIRNIGRSLDCGMFMYHHDNWFLDHGMEYWADSETKASRTKGSLTDLEVLLGTTKPNKILAAHLNPDITTELEKQVKARFSDVVDCFKSSPWYLEIVPKGVNKGTAIQALCRHYGIGKDNVMAIGDYYNDVDMLNASGLPVAMANSPSDVKDIAKYVTEADNNHSGVAEAIYKFIF